VFRLLAALLVLLTACDLNSFRRTPMYGPDTFAPEPGADVKAMTVTASGLRFQDVATGPGPVAASGSEVDVHYTGWLPDGKKVDSSRDRGTPLSFRLGSGQVIRGWEEGVAGMRVGGRRKLVIPAKLGYGAQPVGPIPRNSILVFDVELVGVRP